LYTKIFGAVCSVSELLPDVSVVDVVVVVVVVVVDVDVVVVVVDDELALADICCCFGDVTQLEVFSLSASEVVVMVT
jgi:hypothetical protein